MRGRFRLRLKLTVTILGSGDAAGALRWFEQSLSRFLRELWVLEEVPEVLDKVLVVFKDVVILEEAYNHWNLEDAPEVLEVVRESVKDTGGVLEDLPGWRGSVT